MRHQFPLGLVAALAGALAGCGDSSGPGANQSFRATDPSGDTFGSATVQPDLTAFTIVHDTGGIDRSEEHTSELQSHHDLVCRLLLEKKKKKHQQRIQHK